MLACVLLLLIIIINYYYYYYYLLLLVVVVLLLLFFIIRYMIIRYIIIYILMLLLLLLLFYYIIITLYIVYMPWYPHESPTLQTPRAERWLASQTLWSRQLDCHHVLGAWRWPRELGLMYHISCINISNIYFIILFIYIYMYIHNYIERECFSYTSLHIYICIYKYQIRVDLLIYCPLSLSFIGKVPVNHVRLGRKFTSVGPLDCHFGGGALELQLHRSHHRMHPWTRPWNPVAVTVTSAQWCSGTGRSCVAMFSFDCMVL